MAVTRCELQSYGRSATRDERGRYSYRAVYHVQTDDHNDDAIVVEEGAKLAGPDPLPAYMSVYGLGGSADLSAFAQPLRCVQSVRGDRRKWVFVVTWAPLPPGKSPTETQTSFDNPTLRPPWHWVEYRTISRRVDIDAAGNPIVNSAGKPLEDPIFVEEDLEVLCFERNFATAGEVRSLNRAFRRRLNDAPYGGYPAGHCLVMPIRTGPPEYAGALSYYRATAKVLCNDRPWTEVALDVGFEHLAQAVSNTGDPLAGVAMEVTASDPLLDAAGQIAATVPLTAPVPLSQGPTPPAGWRLPDGSSPLPLTFNVRQSATLTAAAGWPFIPPA